MKRFELIARYRDENRTLCEFRGVVEARDMKEAKANFGRIATGATGFPTLLVLKA